MQCVCLCQSSAFNSKTLDWLWLYIYWCMVNKFKWHIGMSTGLLLLFRGEQRFCPPTYVCVYRRATANAEKRAHWQQSPSGRNRFMYSRTCGFRCGLCRFWHAHPKCNKLVGELGRTAVREMCTVERNLTRPSTIFYLNKKVVLFEIEFQVGLLSIKLK